MTSVIITPRQDYADTPILESPPPPPTSLSSTNTTSLSSTLSSSAWSSVVFNSSAGIPRAHQLSRHPHNPVVFIDVSISGSAAGRIVIELFATGDYAVPLTAENFRQFCTGEHRRHDTPIGYRGTAVQRIQKGFYIEAGDVGIGDGVSIYGGHFADESLTGKHDRAGLVTMANTGANTNASQFFITTGPCSFLDGKHVLVGAVIDGMLLLHKIESVQLADNNKPKLSVTFTQTGEL